MTNHMRDSAPKNYSYGAPSKTDWIICAWSVALGLVLVLIDFINQ